MWLRLLPAAIAVGGFSLLNADTNEDVKVEIISGLIDAEATDETRKIRWALLLAGLSVA